MLSQTSLYALQALSYLVRHQDEAPILSREVGEATGIAGNYLSKIMHQLGSAGILSAERGKRGGYRFAQPPADVRVIDVVNLFQNTEQFRQCVLGRRRCSDEQPCRIHSHWKPASDAMFRFLENTTLADFREDDIPT